MSTQAKTTEERVRRARRGDRVALEVLFSEHYAAALGYARSLVRDGHRARDVVQESFLIAFRDLERLERPGAFGAWLRGIVFRRCQRVFRTRDVPQLELEAIGRGPGPDQQVAERELREQLRALVARLPAEDRQVASLFYLSACSQREVAAFLDLPVSTVNNRLHRARERLKAWRSRTMSLPELESTRVGTIQSIDGTWVEVGFAAEAPTDILDALVVAAGDGEAVEALRVARRLGDGRVGCVLTRRDVALREGLRVLNTGRLTGALGQLVPKDQILDEAGVRAFVETLRGRQDAGSAEAGAEESAPELIETGIKAVDLFAPLAVGGLVGQTGVPGVGRLVLIEELMARSRPDWRLTCVGLIERSDPAAMRGVLEPGVDYSGEAHPHIALAWLLVEGANDPRAAFRDSFDALLDCSPLQAVRGLYPALDPITMTSRHVRESVVGAEQVAVVEDARVLLRRARRLTADPELLGLLAVRSVDAARRRAAALPAVPEGLTPDEALCVRRAARLDAYLTQPFHVAEELTGQPGVHVPRETTVSDVAAILAGAADDMPREALLYGGSLDDMRAAGEDRERWRPGG